MPNNAKIVDLTNFTVPTKAQPVRPASPFEGDAVPIPGAELSPAEVHQRVRVAARDLAFLCGRVLREPVLISGGAGALEMRRPGI